MPEHDKLVEDETRRIEQHERVKSQVQGEIQRELIRDAERVTPAAEAQVKAVSDALKRKAIHEVAETEAEIRKGRSVARVAQVVDYLVHRYGDYVLLRPPVKPTTWLLWFGPPLLLIVGGLAILLGWRRRRAAALARPAPLDADEQARLARLLNEGG